MPQTTTAFLNSSPATLAAQIKRAPSADATLAPAPAKKAKAGASANGAGAGAGANPDAVANFLTAAKQKQAGPAGAPPIQRVPSQSQAQAQAGSAQGSRKPTPNLGTVPLPQQQYVNELKAAALRNGQPQPNLQAALQAYVQAGNGQAVGSAQQSQGQPPQQPSQQQQAFLAQQQQLQQQLAQSQQQQQQQQHQQQQQQPGADQKLTNQQLNALPQIPPEMRANIQERLTLIRAQSSSGAITQEEANKQVQQLQAFANR